MLKHGSHTPIDDVSIVEQNTAAYYVLKCNPENRINKNNVCLICIALKKLSNITYLLIRTCISPSVEVHKLAVMY